jgi:hypothetical protein
VGGRADRVATVDRVIRRSLALAALIAALACLDAPGAFAATTIGQVFTPTAQTTATVVQTGIGSGVGYSAADPAATRSAWTRPITPAVASG